jgi:predicted RNA binding protein YcfA (HicA-like mRNA interferase family)
MDRKEFRERLAQRPRDVRFEEIARLLRLYGWELATIRGSHHVFKREGKELLSIPLRRPRILQAYVRKALDLTGDDDDDDR